jgi:hypothetical protein
VLEGERTFAGVDYGGDMRDRRDRTWLAILALGGERLRVVRLEATGRSGLEAALRDPDRLLMSVEAIGLDFPFALPVPFAESLLGGGFPEDGWWALVRRMERLTRPDFLSAVQDFRQAHGPLKRLADETAALPSPLERIEDDPSPRAYHGIRMIGEDRSRYAVRPFESARARLLLEVRPEVLLRRLVGPEAFSDERARREAVLGRLRRLAWLPVDVEAAFERPCRESTSALLAVLAARCTAAAVLSGEADRTPEELVPGQGERVRREGWIYGLSEAV